MHFQPDNDESQAEYQAKLVKARRDGYRASDRSQIPYYEDLNCDKAWDDGFTQAQAAIREARKAGWNAGLKAELGTQVRTPYFDDWRCERTWQEAFTQATTERQIRAEN